jgi:ribosomal protein S15P/S13E
MTSEKKKLTQKEYEAKIHALAKEGLTSEKIGQKLRDEGIHPAEFKGKISKILGKSYINPDFKNVEAKLERIKVHYENNKQDKRAKREKDRVFSQLRKVKKYFGLIQQKKK